MSWGPYPAESNGSTSAWPNQVAYGCNDGPSGVPELVIHVIILIILNGISISIDFRPR